MGLVEYRNSTSEKERIADLLALVPDGINTVLDVGARDGFITYLLADRYPMVTALDLEKPQIVHSRIICVKGNITALDFPSGSFDLVVCTEVLEHVPTKLLGTACAELVRVSKRCLLIGVPFMQDIRLGRTTCATCGGISPPWGHVNSFSLRSLKKLLHECRVARESYVGVSEEATNFISCFLTDLACNPYGTYAPGEKCISCGSVLLEAPERTMMKKIFTKMAFLIRRVQKPFVRKHPNWIHVLLEK